MRHGTKSDLLACLNIDKTMCKQNPPVNCVIVDGAAAVQMLKPPSNISFSQYAEHFFRCHIAQHLEHADRLDVVFDVYKCDSLKSDTRAKRGDGIRQHVSAEGKVARNWQQFLRTDDNKTELFSFLAKEVTAKKSINKTIVATVKDSVLCSNETDVTMLFPCSHEEADTRMLLHAFHASKCGCNSVMLRTVDTDVVVISISVFHKLNLETLWIAFGVGKNFHYIAVHEIVKDLGPRKSQALSFFHAFTGCDTVSSFSSRGKKSAFETWTALPAVTDAFLEVLMDPLSINQMSVFSVIERFVVLLYDRTSDQESVNTCRKQLFARKNRLMETIPPTCDALMQHVKRACYQSSFIWNKSLLANPAIPSPGDWGWQLVKDKWSPVWMTIPQASTVCTELLKCGCKKGCSGNCKCAKAFMKCTALCYCEGECGNVGVLYDTADV